MAEPSSTPLIVVGPQFCAPNPINLTILGKKFLPDDSNLSVVDGDGKIIFEDKMSGFNFHRRRALLDANGNPLLSMQQKILTTHAKWEVFKGDSWDSKDLLFSTKMFSNRFKVEVDVFLVGNTEEEVYDFKIIGDSSAYSCLVYVGSKVIAEMHVKYWTTKYMVTVQPNVDSAFIIALMIIVNVLFHENNAQAIQPPPNSGI